ncbi:hypothetical protein [Bradyrhizobium sp. BR 10261]|uniref:hypothetical protein n=1 Tax=Bradyrhizobium sp. BR 10261 TaxID=2749992 RepID=UPI001C64BE30|nr:hypothetical protein [Bradyrhizobium sp. BR 10261]MBW7966786.1 hypothetical protein [Bradyrhizobium sp. BR 10261]
MPADRIIATLAGGGEQATKLANVIQLLVIEAGKLGELDIAIHVVTTGQVMTEEEAATMPPEQFDAVKDHLVRVKRFPRRWLERLSDGIEQGVFLDYPDEKIVQAMLMGPR